MIWLGLAIVASSMIAILWKLAERYQCDQLTILRWNYLIAFVLSIAAVLESHLREPFYLNLPLLLRMTVLAIPVGFLFFLSFELYARSIEKNGAILSASIAKMGVFVPIVLSMVIWQEHISVNAILGVTLGFLFLTGYVFYVSYRESARTSFVMLLIWLCVSQGLAEFSNKAFQANFPIEWRGIFLAIVFLSAYISSLKRKKTSNAPATIMNWRIGTFLGLANFSSSFFLIKAFQTLYSPVVYLSFSLGTMMLVTIVTMLWFHEAFTREKQIFMLFSMGVIVLLYS